ncbi:sensor histidine kinase [Planococcus beigongshangi]|uniref:sensor histidine kinase n=1 Tax=Planococcus beigongshangi TaxID=2782536 RepID=UPI00193B3C4A|nr:HAMP domain-containing sensor histidine kinase [Planococcus beigongshangi]
MSLYVKFVWFTFATMLVSSIISFFAMNTYYDQYLKAENNDKNLAIATSIAEFAESVPADQIEATFQMLGDAGYQLYVTDGDTVNRYGAKFRDETIDEADIQQVLQGDAFNGIREFPRETFVTGFFANELENSIGVPLELNGENHALFLRPDIKLLFQELRFLFGGLAVGIIILSFIGMLLVARLLIQPITKLTEATEKMGTETFDVPLSINRKDEIGRLADQFVTMRNRVEQSTLKRKEFVHNVSHDIQSPLHTIQSYLSLLQKIGSNEEEKKKYADIIQEETTHLSLLTNQLLTLASFDKEVQELSEVISIDQQIRDTLSHLRYAFDEKELGISAQLASVNVKGNAVLLQTVWENLLTNAIKYSEPGGAIELSLSSSPKEMVLEIRDEGIGMSAEETVRAFDRFYRADQARVRSVKGSGLGLAIVKEIVELHKGSIEITSSPKAGTTIHVVLPRL